MPLTYTQLLPEVVAAIVHLKEADGSTEKDIFAVINDQRHQLFAEKTVFKKSLNYGKKTANTTKPKPDNVIDL